MPFTPGSLPRYKPFPIQSSESAWSPNVPAFPARSLPHVIPGQTKHPTKRPRRNWPAYSATISASIRRRWPTTSKKQLRGLEERRRGHVSEMRCRSLIPIDEDRTMTAEKPVPQGPQTVSLSDEDAVKQILVSTVFGLWDIVNNLTRLRPSKRDRYRVTIFGSARAQPGTYVYDEVKRVAAALADMGCDIVTG